MCAAPSTVGQQGHLFLHKQSLPSPGCCRKDPLAAQLHAPLPHGRHARLAAAIAKSSLQQRRHHRPVRAAERPGPNSLSWLMAPGPALQGPQAQAEPPAAARAPPGLSRPSVQARLQAEADEAAAADLAAIFSSMTPIEGPSDDEEPAGLGPGTGQRSPHAREKTDALAALRSPIGVLGKELSTELSVESPTREEVEQQAAAQETARAPGVAPAAGSSLQPGGQPAPQQEPPAERMPGQVHHAQPGSSGQDWHEARSQPSSRTSGSVSVH